MRDFQGAKDLGFTDDEVQAIDQANALGQPVGGAVLAFPYRRVMLAVTLGSVLGTLLCWFGSVWKRPLPDPPRALATVAITRRPVYLREEPSMWAQNLRVLPMGSLVTVVEQRSDGFHRVRYGNQCGYVAAMYMALSEGVELVPQFSTRIAAISGSARVREQGLLGAVPTTMLPAFAPVTVMGVMSNGWCLLRAGERTGFIWGGLLEDHPSLPFRPRHEGLERVVVRNGQVLRP